MAKRGYHQIDAETGGVHVPSVSGEGGALKVQPKAEGDVRYFDDADVDNAADGNAIIVYRKAAEGDRYVRLYIVAGQVALFDTDADLFLKSAAGKYVKIEAGDNMYLDLGDDAGVKKLRIRDVNKAEVAAIDSNGNITTIGSVDGRDVATDGGKLDSIDPAATDDQTGAEIKAAYQAEAKAYTDAKDTKLAGIAPNAGVPTKEFFIPAGAGVLDASATWDDSWIALADGVTFARCYFLVRLPADFTSMAAGYPKAVFKQGTGGTGNYRILFEAKSGGVGEQLGARIDSIAEYTRAAPGTSSMIFEEDISGAMDGLTLAAGSYVEVYIQRDSDDVLDTFAGDLDVLGVVIKYS